jgi:heat shock protein HslJ
MRRFAPLLLSLVVIGAAACGDDDDSTDAAEVTAEQLNDRTFVSTDVTGQTLVEGTVVTLVFEGGNVGATAGCNTMSGSYTVEDGVLQVGELAQTLMACTDELQPQDEWVAALLTSGPAIALAGDTLTLTGEDVTLTMSGEAASGTEESIDGTAWTITSLDGPEGALTAPEGATVTIAEGTINVVTGCNTAFGEITVAEDTITVGPLASTRIACEPELMAWETALLQFLDGELTVDASDAQVVLTKGDTTLTLEPLV